MKAYSRTREDVYDTFPLQEAPKIYFMKRNMDIHGRVGDTVYRHKRNGELYYYPYVFKPRYAPTVLSRRSECLFREADKFTNSSRPGYKVIISKMFYYTPYFVYPGDYKFSCNTFLKLRKKGEYNLQIDEGLKLKLRLAPRTKLEISFETAGEHTVKCWKNEFLYCERQINVLNAEEDLEAVYAQWFAEHLWEILALPEPQYAPLEKYFRCVMPPNWMLTWTGKCEGAVLYSTRKSYLDLGVARYDYMYVRRYGSFQGNSQSEYFSKVQPRVMSCWKAAGREFHAAWEKYHIRWFDSNYRKFMKRTQIHNFWSHLVFRAAKKLGFDLETLSVENWLPGVETIGELLLTAKMGHYGLKPEELNVRIF
ncbi:MAG: hypothetical protein K9N06_07100 [Candidatus Cloacimonetes bacterium]|nr:hypothetical protein [Candidatus Cloacimonadota bacterium]